MVNLQIRGILVLFNDSKGSETAIKVENLNELANYATGDIPIREEALVSEFQLDLTYPDYKASWISRYSSEIPKRGHKGIVPDTYPRKYTPEKDNRT